MVRRTQAPDFDENGMSVIYAPSDFDNVRYGFQISDLNLSSNSPKFPLGTKVITVDDRIYRYARITQGALTQLGTLVSYWASPILGFATGGAKAGDTKIKLGKSRTAGLHG